MNKKNEIRQELEEIAPLLADVQKGKIGFRIPENYFTQLQYNVIRQINTTPEVAEAAPSFFQRIINDSIRTIGLMIQPLYVLRLAGFGLVLAVAIFLLLPGGGAKDYLSELTPSEVTDYVNGNIDEFDLEVVLEVAELDPTALFPGSGFYEEALDDYIDDILDDFDLEELEEML